MNLPQAIGLDLGTGGVRGVRISPQGQLCVEARSPLAARREATGVHEHDPEALLEAVGEVLTLLLADAKPEPLHIAIAGTSGSLLLAERDSLRACTPCLLYDDRQAQPLVDALDARLPASSGARGGGSSAARWLHLVGASKCATTATASLDSTCPMHPADWVAARLAERRLPIDHNNGLKLGLDPETGTWPKAFLHACAAVLAPDDGDRSIERLRDALPRAAVEPGTPLAPLSDAWRQRLGVDASAAFDITICAGTTDSVAAFVASMAVATSTAEPHCVSGAEAAPGAPDPLRIGVTSLGSTLVLKQLAERPLRDARTGVYSHRLGSRWLVGGASNSGGAALAKWFNAETLARHSAEINLDRTVQPCYPLPGRGERFPDPDADRVALWPERKDDTAFVHDLLAGIAAIEADGYRRLEALGAAPLAEVRSNGGGADNETWRRIRERMLGVPCRIASGPRGDSGPEPRRESGVAGRTESAAESQQRSPQRSARPSHIGAEAAMGAALLAQRGADAVFDRRTTPGASNSA